MNTSTPPSGDGKPDAAVVRKSLIAAGLGQVLEWYDWLIFALLAGVISKQFFPATDPTAALLSTLVVFGIGFFFRPLGGILLARFTDRRGRKAGMILTILMMSGGSLLIGIAPTYQQAGLLAPLLLVVARIMQGLSAGGELPAVTAYITELAPANKRGQYGSLVWVTANTGSLLATLTIPLMNSTVGAPAVAEWAWRIPFIVAAALGLFTLFMRSGASETEAFMDAVEARRGKATGGVRELFSNHLPDVARLFCISALVGVWYYVFASYLPVYQVSRGMNPQDAFQSSICAIILFTCTLPFLGRWSDLFGRRKVLLAFTGLATLAAVPLFSFLEPTFWSQFAVQLAALFIFGLYAAVGPATMAEQFPTSVRALGIGLPYGLAVAAFGGSAPYVIQKLKAENLTHLFNWYLMAIAFVALIATLSIKERRTQDLSDV
ncbi:MAG: MFS transporter [Burkholderiales bacterium]|nr:MAG: MFS transporter [Burkholderiales bacterium]